MRRRKAKRGPYVTRGTKAAMCNLLRHTTIDIERLERALTNARAIQAILIRAVGQGRK